MGIPTKVPIDLVNPTPAASTDLSNYVDLTSAQTISGSKTVSSDLNLQPSNSSANTGGKINFHYNQSSSATSSIYENASGQIRVDGDLKLNGKLSSVTSTIRADKVYYRVVDLGTGIRPTTSTIAQRWDSTIVFNNSYDNKTLSSIYNPLKYTSATDWQNSIQLLVYDLTQENRNATLQLGFNQNGAFTLCPTPPVNSNDGSIATTAFVNNRLPYTSGTWTPTCYGNTTAGSTTISGNNCQYVKIGKLVILSVAFTFTVNTEPAGQVRIGGLPFSAARNAYGMFWCSGHYGFILTASGTIMYIRTINSSTGIPYLISWGTSTPWDNTVDSTGSVEGSIVYFTA